MELGRRRSHSSPQVEVFPLQGVDLQCPIPTLTACGIQYSAWQRIGCEGPIYVQLSCSRIIRHFAALAFLRGRDVSRESEPGGAARLYQTDTHTTYLICSVEL